MPLRLLRDANNIKKKTVFYRPDYNVPLKNGVIQDDYRITATFPTIDYLREQGCRIIIGSHLGRPEGQIVETLDLRPVVERLADHYDRVTVRYAHDVMRPEVAKAVEAMGAGDILVLPNLRFYAEEEANNPGFAQVLADLADIYVNDAFACDHRAHASIVGIPSLIPGYAGFLLEKEVENLGNLVNNPQSPFVVIMGGAKVSDKIEMINNLAKKADHILIGGAMANTFLLAKGEKVGHSKVEAEKVELAEDLLAKHGDKLVLAKDYVKDNPEAETDFAYLDIGPQAIEEFKVYLAKAKTIFWNGSLGYTEDPQFAVATKEIAGFIGGLGEVVSVVAGGDTVETITAMKLHDRFTFVSTGGGAALEFLAGKEMPGVKALEGEKDEVA